MATIKDVARLAGVGLGTASRVVSGRGSVAPKTVERVKKAIEELDFRPSHAARSLLSGSSQMIGVYVPVLKGTFYMPILQTIDTELRAAGLHMVLAFGVGTGDARRQSLDGIEFLTERGCDGLIVMSNSLLEDDLQALGPKQSRLVVLNDTYATIADQCFCPDHVQGGALAARALLDQKHRRIAVIAGPSNAPDNVARIKGFIDELGRAGIDKRSVWITESDFSPAGGWSAAEKLVTSGHKFSALFCANDEMALGALSYFQQAGLAVPGDVSVIGYDDTPSAEFSAPRLTSVNTASRELTRNAVHELLNRCYGAGNPVERVFPLGVTQRASLGPARPV